MNSLVIGGKGFIGSHLVNRLKNPVVVDLKDGNDATSYLYHNAPKDIDVVYHLGAHLQPTNDVDVLLHRAVQIYCKDVGAYLVYSSSAAVYSPDSLYAIQKLYGEVVLHDIPHTFLRFFNVYGDGGSGIVDKIKRREDFKINGNGEQRRDYVYVLDVVDALITAAETRLQGTFDVGTGDSTSVNELMDIANVEREYQPGDPGVTDSVAMPDPRFPWSAQSDVVDYLYEKA